MRIAQAVFKIPGNDNLISDILINLSHVMRDRLGNIPEKIVDQFEIAQMPEVLGNGSRGPYVEKHENALNLRKRCLEGGLTWVIGFVGDGSGFAE